jgi:hypothetical protein
VCVCVGGGGLRECGSILLNSCPEMGVLMQQPSLSDNTTSSQSDHNVPF